jgi:hypothetical protein
MSAWVVSQYHDARTVLTDRAASAAKARNPRSGYRLRRRRRSLSRAIRLTAPDRSWTATRRITPRSAASSTKPSRAGSSARTNGNLADSAMPPSTVERAIPQTAPISSVIRHPACLAGRPLQARDLKQSSTDRPVMRRPGCFPENSSVACAWSRRRCLTDSSAWPGGSFGGRPASAVVPARSAWSPMGRAGIGWGLTGRGPYDRTHAGL